MAKAISHLDHTQTGSGELASVKDKQIGDFAHNVLWPLLGVISPPAGTLLIVELSTEAAIYLREAQLSPVGGLHAARYPPAFNGRSTWVWRQIPQQAAGKTALALSWTAIATASSSEPYTCILHVRDARGNLLPPLEGSANPLRIERIMGPEAEPSDLGQAFICVEPQHSAAARAAS